MSKRARIGDVIEVDNTSRKFGSADKYLFMRIQLDNGDEYPVLFTHMEIGVAIGRAEENKEDLIEVSKIRNLLD